MIFRGAALFIGLWDLFLHSIALCMLILMFGQASYADFNPTAEQARHSNEILFRQHFNRHNLSHSMMQMNARSFYSHMNLLTMKWAQSLSQRKPKEKAMEIIECLFVSFLEDKYIVLCILFSVTLLILIHLYGVLTVSLFRMFND